MGCWVVCRWWTLAWRTIPDGSRVVVWIPFVIVIPRVLSIFYTCNVDMCLSVDIRI